MLLLLLIVVLFVEDKININIILPRHQEPARRLLYNKRWKSQLWEKQEDQAGRPIVQVFMPGIMPVYTGIPVYPYQVAKLLKNKMFLYLFKKNILI